MPRLTIITPMAASKIYIILENARVPLEPISFIIRSAFTRVTQTISIFIAKDTKVGQMPKLSSIISVVVKTAGPVIKGVPNGKTPTFFSWPSDKTCLDTPGSNRRTEIMNKSAPPAIWKSGIVMPINLNTHLPTKINKIAIAVAVATESIIILCLSFFVTSSTSEINKGILPMASTATKIGIKVKI